LRRHAFVSHLTVSTIEHLQLLQCITAVNCSATASFADRLQIRSSVDMFVLALGPVQQPSSHVLKQGNGTPVTAAP
jgi:hypothetical protein